MMNKRTYGLLLLLTTVSNGFAIKEERKKTNSERLTMWLLGDAFKEVAPGSRTYIEDIFANKGIENVSDIPMYEMIDSSGMQCPNAAIAKIGAMPEMVMLFPFIADMIEKSVVSESKTDEYYTTQIRFGCSPYSLKLTIKNKDVESMVRGVLEHESGHMKHKHLKIMSKGQVIASSLFISAVALYIYLNKEILKNPPLKVAPEELKEDYKELVSNCVLGGTVAFVSFAEIIEALKQGRFLNSVEKEWEADATVSDDVDTLKGAARFFIILDTMCEYIYSYQSSIIRFYAWKKGIKPHEFYAQNKLWCQRWVFSDWFNPSHPPIEKRIEKIKERIAQLTDKEVADVNLFDHSNYAIDVYNDGKIVAAL